jgi:hypothetical protein
MFTFSLFAMLMVVVFCGLFDSFGQSQRGVPGLWSFTLHDSLIDRFFHIMSCPRFYATCLRVDPDHPRVGLRS